jgi:hypothetical protein
MTKKSPKNGKAFIEHLLAVCRDRVLLFDLRQVGTKRAIKAMARLNEPPQADRLMVAFRAEINYFTHHSAIRVLSYYINQFQEKDKKIKQESNPKNVQIQDLLYSQDCIQRFTETLRTTDGLFKKIVLINTDYRLLFESVFTLDEDKQRDIIDGIIKKNLEQICRFVFKEMVVLDSEYIEKAITQLTLFLKKN